MLVIDARNNLPNPRASPSWPACRAALTAPATPNPVDPTCNAISSNDLPGGLLNLPPSAYLFERQPSCKGAPKRGGRAVDRGRPFGEADEGVELSAASPGHAMPILPRARAPLIAGFILFALSAPAPAAEPWERDPTPAQLAELRQQVAALGGRSYPAAGAETIILPAADFLKLPPIRFRVGVGLTDQTADADLQALARQAGIVALTASGANVTDAGLKGLAPLKGLARLDLSHSAVTDGGLADLPPLPALRELRLVGTKVTADGARHLGGRKLRTLELPEAARTNDGLRHYVAAVEWVESFDSHYGWPGVTDDGLAALAGQVGLRSFTWWPGKKLGAMFREVLPTLTNLEHLHLEGADIRDGDVKSLAALPKLDSLNIAGTSVTDTGLRHLAGHRTLAVLYHSRLRLTDAGLKELVRMPALRELFLADTAVTDDGMRTLAAAPELRELHLEGTKVTPAGLKAFAGRKLRMVWGDEALRTEDVLLVLLPNMPAGDELDLGRWRMTDAGLAQVGKRRGLKRLAVRGEFSEKGLAGLAALAELRSLRVATGKFTAAGVRPWRDLAHLRSLELHGTVSEAVLLELKGFKSLTDLKVGGALTTAEMRAIARIETLESLTLDDAGFSDDGAAALARSPRLANLSARQSDLTDDGLVALAAAKTLKWVDVSYSRVTANGKAVFARLRTDCEVYEGE
jgi:internalin A